MFHFSADGDHVLCYSNITYMLKDDKLTLFFPTLCYVQLDSAFFCEVCVLILCYLLC